MAAVGLVPAVLSLADDPSQALAVLTADRSETVSAQGSVRRMANGRLRVVQQAGKATSISVKLPSVTAAQVAVLRDWTGRLVLYRDKWGRKVYGAWFELQVTDYPEPDRYDVSLSLSEASYSEAV